MTISGETLDDILYNLYNKIKKDGKQVTGTKGTISEILGIYIKLTDPISRLSRSRTRGLTISPLGELLWYLSGSDSSQFIEYYIKNYKDYSDKGTIYGAYGPRLFNMNGNLNQVHHVINLLNNNSSTKKAVIQIYDASDLIHSDAKDIPCTCTLQFIIRDNQLHLFTNMRSNDAFKGFVHDVFCFTMLQELVARYLNINLGYYHHFVSSMHIYCKDMAKVDEYLQEGYQSTNRIMQPIPQESICDNIKTILKIEKDIRNHVYPDIKSLNLSSYWKDIVILLYMYAIYKKSNSQVNREIIQLSHLICNKEYRTVLQDKYPFIRNDRFQTL